MAGRLGSLATYIISGVCYRVRDLYHGCVIVMEHWDWDLRNGGWAIV